MNNQIKKLLFPIHTLANFEILQYADLIGLAIDCLPKDKVPKSIPINTGIIVNLNDAGQSGSHWVCAVNKNGKCLYYDSFGIEHIPVQLKRTLVNSVGKNNIFMSDGQNQHLISILCGYYCLKVCKSILMDGMSFEKCLNQFTDNPSAKNADIADNLYI